jgi:hypothetical protein
MLTVLRVALNQANTAYAAHYQVKSVQLDAIGKPFSQGGNGLHEALRKDLWMIGEG